MNQYKTFLAGEIGNDVPLTRSAIQTVIDILENYELSGTYELSTDSSYIDKHEQHHADEIVSVINLLKSEYRKSIKNDIAKNTWAKAKEQGWNKNNPSHRKHVNDIINNYWNTIKENY
jgi:hypothetical protein